MKHDLVDELRLVIFPVVLGIGERFFGETGVTKPMRLVNTQTLGEGLVFLTYQFLHQGRLTSRAAMAASERLLRGTARRRAVPSHAQGYTTPTSSVAFDV